MLIERLNTSRGSFSFWGLGSERRDVMLDAIARALVLKGATSAWQQREYVGALLLFALYCSLQE